MALAVRMGWGKTAAGLEHAELEDADPDVVPVDSTNVVGEIEGWHGAVVGDVGEEGSRWDEPIGDDPVGHLEAVDT
tara:strand:+ start:94 stop:321 length:228 start_codon:yes stop_codon:yes gene_type:complete